MAEVREAARRGVPLLEASGARKRPLRLKEQRARGNALDIDELEDLPAAAEELNQKVTPKVLERGAAARELRHSGEWSGRRWLVAGLNDLPLGSRGRCC